MNRSSRDAEPERTVLGNGLTLLAQHRSGSPLAAVLILYKAGSLEEPPGRSGVAHLTEHMLFRGTARFPQGRIDALTSSLGGVNNAMTTCDHALYYFVLPVEHWRVPLAVEADRMVNCSLDPAQFQTERRIVLEERRMLDDDPDASLEEAVSALAFRRHPYRFPVAGLREHIEGLTLADLRAFYDTCYVPGNAVLAVVGGIDPDEVASLVETEFGGLDGGEPTAREAVSEPAQTSARHIEMGGEDRAARIVLAFRAPAATHPDSAALEVLSGLLASGRSSRLHSELVVRERLAADVFADRVLTVEPGLFTISAVLRVGADLRSAHERALGVLHELRDSGVPEDELRKTKSLLELDYLLGLETSLGAASSLALWESLGGWELGPAFESRVMGVSAADVGRVLETYFAPEAMSTAWRTARPR